MLHLRSSSTDRTRFPLSTLAPTPLISENGARMKAMLRHPRSRIRITPGWSAPSLHVSLASADALIHVSKHRVTPVMWEKLTGRSAPQDQPIYLVTLSAAVDEESISGSLSSVTADIHSLFRTVAGSEWTQKDRVGENLTWTWHCLVTQSDLEGKVANPAAHVA